MGSANHVNKWTVFDVTRRRPYRDPINRQVDDLYRCAAREQWRQRLIDGAISCGVIAAIGALVWVTT